MLLSVKVTARNSTTYGLLSRRVNFPAADYVRNWYGFVASFPFFESLDVLDEDDEVFLRLGALEVNFGLDGVSASHAEYFRNLERVGLLRGYK